jgi:rhodanese-related sulfurtransferase
MLIGGLVSCNPSEENATPTPSETPTPGQPTSAGEFDTIRQAADAYVNSGQPLFITAQQLSDSITAAIGIPGFDIKSYDPLTYTKGPLIIDVRSSDPEKPDVYLAGHIPGSVHIPWQQLPQYIQNLPKDRQIVVVSGTGQTGGAAAAILNVLGYDAVNLMWGMTSWTSDPTVAPGRYNSARDTVFDWGGSYRAVCPISEPDDIYSFPVVENTDSRDRSEVLKAAAEAYLSDGSKRFDMTSFELYEALYYDVKTQQNPSVEWLFQSLFFTGTATGNPYTVPFFLDVRDDDTYLNGHLCGTLHVYWKNVFKPENLQKLPLDRQILVYSDTGHESGAITAMLNMLGYDAINLRWGITSWSLSLPGKDIAPERFDPSRDTMNYEMVSGFDPFVPSPGAGQS